MGIERHAALIVNVLRRMMWSRISVCVGVLTCRGGVYCIGVYSVCGGELINKGVNVVGEGGERCRHTVEV